MLPVSGNYGLTAALSCSAKGVKAAAAYNEAKTEAPETFPDVVAGDFQRFIVAKIPQVEDVFHVFNRAHVLPMQSAD